MLYNISMTHYCVIISIDKHMNTIINYQQKNIQIKNCHFFCTPLIALDILHLWNLLFQATFVRVLNQCITNKTFVGLPKTTNSTFQSFGLKILPEVCFFLQFSKSVSFRSFLPSIQISCESVKPFKFQQRFFISSCNGSSFACVHYCCNEYSFIVIVFDSVLDELSILFTDKYVRSAVLII